MKSSMEKISLPRIITIIRGLRYSTEVSVLLAYQEDVKESDICGLYRTPKGAYFGTFKNNKFPSGALVPIDKDVAMDWYAAMQTKVREFSEAFPDVQIQDA